MRASVPISDNKLTPQSLEAMDRMAQYIAASGMYGIKDRTGFRPYTRYECAAIIACGRRFGWDPYSAMEQVALIRNKTRVWGKGVRAAVLASGKCVEWDEKWEGLAADGTCTDKTVAIVRLRRKGMKTWFEGRFSVAEAKQAKLWGNPGPWTDYPANQLLWRAVGFAVDRGFADVMMGQGIAEVALDEPTEGDKTASELQRRLDAAGATP